MQIIRQLPVIDAWRDALLALEDLAEAISIIKVRAPHRFQTQISGSPLWGIQHRSLEWQPAVVTTIQLGYLSLLVLL